MTTRSSKALESSHPLRPLLATSLASPQGLALGTLLCYAVPLIAAEPEKKSEQATVEMQEIVVEGTKDAPNYKPEALSSTKYTQPLREVPQTVQVVPQAVMQERGATSLRDVLKNVPGISMQAGEGGAPAGDNLSIRGFGARSDIFVDGVRDTAGGGYSRDPFNIESVEVAKGPASANSGRGSTGGSINMVTKAPQLDSFYRGELTGGTDRLFRSTLDINVPLWENGGAVAAAPTGKGAVSGKGVTLPTAAESGAAFRFNAMYHDQDIPGRDYVNNQRWGVAPSFAFGLGTDTRFTLNFMHLDQDNVPDYGIPWVSRTSTNPDLLPGVPPVPLSNYYGSLTRDYERIKTDLATGIFEHDFSDDLKFRTALRWGRNDRDSITSSPRFTAVNTSSAITRNFTSRDQLDESLSWQSDLRWDVATGSVKHEIVAGFEASREDSRNNVRISSNGNTPATTLFNPDPWAPYTGVISYNGAYTDTTGDTLAFYLFDTIKLSPKWTLTAGLRHDTFQLDYANRSATGTMTSLDREDDMLSYRAALNYKPAENGSIYFGYGTSFNPSTEGLAYIAAPTATNSTLSLFNADPEENRTMELGTKWDLFDEKLALTAAIFRTEKTNARTIDPADPTEVTLTGEQMVQGFELGFTGHLTERWRIIGGYTYLDSEVEKSAVPAEVGSEVSNTPEHSFSLWTMHQFTDKLEAGLGAQYVGDRFNGNNATTRQTAGDYITVDAVLSYKISDTVTLRLNGYNLFDEEYIDRVGGGHFVPGQGRSVALTASFNF